MRNLIYGLLLILILLLYFHAKEIKNLNERKQTLEKTDYVIFYENKEIPVFKK